MRKGPFRRYNALLIGAPVLMIAACATAQLDEDEYLYGGGEVSIRPEDEAIAGRRSLERGLESGLSPDPNTAFLGIRPGLWI